MADEIRIQTIENGYTVYLCPKTFFAKTPEEAMEYVKKFLKIR